MENTVWKRLWIFRQADYALIEYVFVCVSCNIYVYMFVSNSRQLHCRTVVLVSTERSPTNGKNYYVQNFPSQIFLQPPLVLNQPAESTYPWRRLWHGYHRQHSRDLNGWKTEGLQWKSWDGDVHVHYSTINTWKGCGYAGLIFGVRQGTQAQVSTTVFFWVLMLLRCLLVHLIFLHFFM